MHLESRTLLIDGMHARPVLRVQFLCSSLHVSSCRRDSCCSSLHVSSCGCDSCCSGTLQPRHSFTHGMCRTCFSSQLCEGGRDDFEHVAARGYGMQQHACGGEGLCYLAHGGGLLCSQVIHGYLHSLTGYLHVLDEDCKQLNQGDIGLCIIVHGCTLEDSL